MLVKLFGTAMTWTIILRKNGSDGVALRGLGRSDSFTWDIANSEIFSCSVADPLQCLSKLLAAQASTMPIKTLFLPPQLLSEPWNCDWFWHWQMTVFTGSELHVYSSVMLDCLCEQEFTQQDHSEWKINISWCISLQISGVQLMARHNLLTNTSNTMLVIYIMTKHF